jgi:hypothetical protein
MLLKQQPLFIMRPYKTQKTAQNYWAFGVRPTTGVQETTKHTNWEIGYVSVLRCGGKTPQLRP